MSYCDLTPQQFDIFKTACQNAFNAISQDIVPCSRDEVVECVLDAERLMMYGWTRNMGVTREDFTKLYKDVFNPMINKHFMTSSFNVMMKKIFPFARYI